MHGDLWMTGALIGPLLWLRKKAWRGPNIFGKIFEAEVHVDVSGLADVL